MQDWDKMIEAMQEFCAPEAREKRLREKWTKATDIKALHVQLDTPAPDGDFEILFIDAADCDRTMKIVKTAGKVDIISYIAGVALAKQNNCCGGEHSLMEAEIIAKVQKSDNYPAPSSV